MFIIKSTITTKIFIFLSSLVKILVLSINILNNLFTFAKIINFEYSSHQLLQMI